MLYLVRHANPQIDAAVPANQWQLSAAGIERAHQLAQYLDKAGIQAVISSPEAKAIQTAQILAEQWGLEVEVMDGIHEHERPWSPDSFTRVVEFQSRIQQFFLQPGELVFGAETADQCHARFEGALRQIISQHQNRRLAVVTHGTVLSLLLSRYNRLDVFTFWQALGMPASIRVEIPDFQIKETWTPAESPQRA